jgi:exodeoxyribonuclease VII large subunit
MFRRANLRLKFAPRDGLQVLARGNLGSYPGRSEYQLVVEELLPKGIGTAELALQQLKEKLHARGYFDPARKKPLPSIPKRIGLVTSAAGAAVRDMIELFAQRWPGVELIVRHCRVQGETAGAEVAAALRLFNHLHRTGKLPLCAIIVGRGGGSAEDLSAFNEEIVAEAIVLSGVPVVSAVGHETDVTIADLVADRRVETPSAAVMSLVPDRRQLLATTEDLHTRLVETMCRRIELAHRSLERIRSRPAFDQPLLRIEQLGQRLDDTASRMNRAARSSVSKHENQLSAIASRLENLSPLKVLQRGYSLTHTEAGRLVRAAGDVKTGERITTRLGVGEIVSQVLPNVNNVI